MQKIEKIGAEISHVNSRIMSEAQKRLDNLTKPQQSLGKLEEFAKRVAGITGSIKPSLKNKVIFTMTGDHGVVRQNVSLFHRK